MEIDIGKIPRGTKSSDYPPDTIFVFKEGDRPKRDPKTGELIEKNKSK